MKILLASIVSLSAMACAFGEEADPPFSSSLGKSLALQDLSSQDVDRFCREYLDYLAANASLDRRCTYAGVLLVKTQGGDTAACQERHQQCLDSPWEPACQLTGDEASACPATVGALDRCAAAEAAELLALIRSVNCVDLTVSITYPRPEACSEIEQSCPGFYD